MISARRFAGRSGAAAIRCGDDLDTYLLAVGFLVDTFPVLTARYCMSVNSPLILLINPWPVTPEVAGSSPVALAIISKGYAAV